jgi:hypothetical protein
MLRKISKTSTNSFEKGQKMGENRRKMCNKLLIKAENVWYYWERSNIHSKNGKGKFFFVNLSKECLMPV